MNSTLAQFKSAPRLAHERLKRRLRLFDPEFCRRDYLVLFQAFLCFYRPLETRLAGLTILSEWISDSGCRVKNPWLKVNLAALRVDAAGIAPLPASTQMPATGRLAQPPGCIYVLEGAALGGPVIAAQTRRAFGFEAARNIFLCLEVWLDSRGLLREEPDHGN